MVRACDSAFAPTLLRGCLLTLPCPAPCALAPPCLQLEWLAVLLQHRPHFMLDYISARMCPLPPPGAPRCDPRRPPIHSAMLSPAVSPPAG